MTIVYRGMTIERDPTKSPLPGWKVFTARGVMIACGLPDFASARREVDAHLGPHAEPVDDRPRDEPHYD